MLSRQAALRFGPAVGEEIRILLNDTEDWDRLARVAELVVSTETGGELADAVAALAEAQRPKTS